MKLSGNTILITGGSSGIGLAFAERFIKAGNKVIVFGRRENVLQHAKEKFPGLITHVCDLDIESERVSLFDWVTANYPEVNVLVNNAGIQQRFNVLKADAKNNWIISVKKSQPILKHLFTYLCCLLPFSLQKKRRQLLTLHLG